MQTPDPSVASGLGSALGTQAAWDWEVAWLPLLAEHENLGLLWKCLQKTFNWHNVVEEQIFLNIPLETYLESTRNH